MKPDAVQRGLIGDILGRFEKTGLKVVAAKMFTVSENLANKHYPADRESFVVGMGHKTLDNYKALEKDAEQELGTKDPKILGELVRSWLVEFITSGPVLAVVIEGPHSIELVRKIAGNTLPILANPGTIRGDYSFDSSYFANRNKRSIKNLIHASGDADEAAYEIPLWFSQDEIQDYHRADEQVVH